MTNPTRTECNHFFCLACLQTWLTSSNTCPQCRHVLYERDQQIHQRLNRDLGFHESADDELDEEAMLSDMERAFASRNVNEVVTNLRDTGMSYDDAIETLEETLGHGLDFQEMMFAEWEHEEAQISVGRHQFIDVEPEVDEDDEEDPSEDEEDGRDEVAALGLTLEEFRARVVEIRDRLATINQQLEANSRAQQTYERAGHGGSNILDPDFDDEDEDDFNPLAEISDEEDITQGHGNVFDRDDFEAEQRQRLLRDLGFDEVPEFPEEPDMDLVFDHEDDNSYHEERQWDRYDDFSHRTREQPHAGPAADFFFDSTARDSDEETEDYEERTRLIENGNSPVAGGGNAEMWFDRTFTEVSDFEDEDLESQPESPEQDEGGMVQAVGYLDQEMQNDDHDQGRYISAEGRRRRLLIDLGFDEDEDQDSESRSEVSDAGGLAEQPVIDMAGDEEIENTEKDDELETEDTVMSDDGPGNLAANEPTIPLTPKTAAGRRRSERIAAFASSPNYTGTPARTGLRSLR